MLTGLASAAAIVVAAIWLRPIIAYRTLESTISEILKSKRKTDQGVQAYSRAVIRSFEREFANGNEVPVAQEKDLDALISLSENYTRLAAGASEPLATYCFLFERLCSEFTDRETWPALEDDQTKRLLPRRDILNFGYNYAVGVLNLSSDYVAFPHRFKALKSNPLKWELQGLTKRPGLTSIPGASDSIDISPLSYPVVSFYNGILKTSLNRHHEIFRRFFQELNDNSCVLITLLANGVYFPIKLEHRASSILGPLTLDLVNIQVEIKYQSGCSEPFEVCKLTYSNLSRMGKFVQGLEHSAIGKLRSCDEFSKGCTLSDYSEKYNRLNAESISIEVPKNVGESNLKDKKGEIENYLIMKAGRNWAVEKSKLILYRLLNKRPRLASSLGLDIR